jgi:predicted anti-sigma-YlaC factor YlaD
MEKVAPLKSACKNFEEDLVLHYYGENSETDRRRVEQHLLSCLPCRSFLDDLHRLLPQITQHAVLPQAFWDDYYRETVAKLALREERKFRWQDLFAPIRLWMVPAFGTVAIAILAIAIIVGKGGVTTLLDRPTAEIPQEILVDSNQLEFFKSLDMLESLGRLEHQDGDGTAPKSNQSSLGNSGETLV